MTSSTEHRAIERLAKEFAYTLIVKASTLPVYADSKPRREEPDGLLLMSFLSVMLVEPDDLLNLLHSYPCLGKLDFLHSEMDNDSKAQRKLNSIFQRRACHPHSFEFIEVFAQIDVFCSIEQGFALDEVEYVKHNLHEIYDSHLEVADCRLFAFCTRYDRDHTNGYKMVQKGYQRIAFDLSMLIGVAKD